MSDEVYRCTMADIERYQLFFSRKRVDTSLKLLFMQEKNLVLLACSVCAEIGGARSEHPEHAPLHVPVYQCNYRPVEHMLKLLLNSDWPTELNNSINPDHHFASHTGSGISHLAVYPNSAIDPIWALCPPKINKGMNLFSLRDLSTDRTVSGCDWL